MKFESINSKTFEQFKESKLSNLHMVIGGWYYSENLANQPSYMVDRFETLTGNGGDGQTGECDNRKDHWV